MLLLRILKKYNKFLIKKLIIIKKLDRVVEQVFKGKKKA